MKTLKRMTAAACALCLCAVYPAYGGFTGGPQHIWTEDISSLWNGALPEWAEAASFQASLPGKEYVCPY